MNELETDIEEMRRKMSLEERRAQLLADFRASCENPATVRVFTHILARLCLGKAQDEQGIILQAAATVIFSDIKQASPETARTILLSLFGLAQ